MNNTTNGNEPLTRKIVNCIITDSVTIFLDGIVLLLLLLVFIGNRSFVMFLPKKTLLSSKLGSKMRRYRTRAILNWALLLSIMYILSRMISEGLILAGYVRTMGKERIIARLGEATSILVDQFYMIPLSVIIILWTRVAFSLISDETTKRERIMQYILYASILILNSISFVAVTLSATIVLIGKQDLQKHPKAYQMISFRVGPSIHATCIILLTLIAVIMGIILIIMIYRDIKSSTSYNSEEKRQKILTIIKSSITMLFLFLAVNIRSAGLLLIVINMPLYVWSLLTRGTSDFFGLTAVVILFWPFRVPKIWTPIIRIHLHEDNTEEERDSYYVEMKNQE
jgi:hypothetical protein